MINAGQQVSKSLTPLTTESFNYNATKGKQMMTAAPKTKSALPLGYFDKDFKRVMEVQPRPLTSDANHIFNRENRTQTLSRSGAKMRLPRRPRTRPARLSPILDPNRSAVNDALYANT